MATICPHCGKEILMVAIPRGGTSNVAFLNHVQDRLQAHLTEREFLKPRIDARMKTTHTTGHTGSSGRKGKKS